MLLIISFRILPMLGVLLKIVTVVGLACAVLTIQVCVCRSVLLGSGLVSLVVLGLFGQCWPSTVAVLVKFLTWVISETY